MYSKVRQTVVAGVLGAVSILLAITGLGRIPMPTGVAATIMHVPAILAGIVEGPFTGAGVGLIFGVYSFLQPLNPFFADPLVAVMPRFFIGITAALAYRRSRRLWVAAVIGTITNTLGVLGMMVLRGHMPLLAVVPIAVSHGIPEIIVAVLLVGAIGRYLALTGRKYR
ncbi:MAG: ECF transporter S component [Limnochordia bacterium]